MTSPHSNDVIVSYFYNNASFNGNDIDVIIANVNFGISLSKSYKVDQMKHGVKSYNLNEHI